MDVVIVVVPIKVFGFFVKVHCDICFTDNGNVGVVNMKPFRVLSQDIASIVSTCSCSSMVIDYTKQLVRDSVRRTTGGRNEF